MNGTQQHKVNHQTAECAHEWNNRGYCDDCGAPQPDYEPDDNTMPALAVNTDTPPTPPPTPGTRHPMSTHPEHHALSHLFEMIDGLEEGEQWALVRELKITKNTIAKDLEVRS
jgi:hypothetical protein